MKILLTAFVLLGFVACDSARPSANISGNREFAARLENRKAQIPAAWKLLSVCSFEFYVPPDFEEKKVQPIDSCVKNYVGENIELLIDEIGTGIDPPDFSRSHEYSLEKDYLLEKTVVDGEPAEIITFAGANEIISRKDLIYSAVLDVPQAGLTIWAHCQNTADRETAKKIFKSVKFPAKE